MGIETIRPQAGRFEKQRRKLAHIVPLLLRSVYDTKTRKKLQDGILHKNRPGHPGGFA
jgi:hypothetical protein